MTLWFDMDGTFVNLYLVFCWLEKLIALDPSPYIDAKPMFSMSLFARYLHRLQAKGYKIGIITWLSKNPDPTYAIEVTIAKLKWLEKHLPSVRWDYINIVPYGTPKHEVCKEGILFDDEENNRKAWKCGRAYDASIMLDVLREMVKG